MSAPGKGNTNFLWWQIVACRWVSRNRGRLIDWAKSVLLQTPGVDLGPEHATSDGWASSFGSLQVDADKASSECLCCCSFQTLSVLNPMKTPDAAIMQDTDLAGPLVFCLMFGGSLLLVSALQAR